MNSPDEAGNVPSELSASSWDRDSALAEILRLGGAGIPLHAVDWDRLHRSIIVRAHEARGERQRQSWWEIAAQSRRLAVAASLAALLTAAALLHDGPLESQPGPPLALSSESLALAHLAQAIREDEGFTALVRAAGGDLYAHWKEP